MELRPEITAYYEQGREAQRLFEARTGGPLEFARTIELIGRYLAPAPLEVLDVGGGPGSYARWLHDRGDDVTLIDPVALHVEQARAQSLRAEVGDARHLAQPDRCVDVVLLMGPLYHLVEEDGEARWEDPARREALLTAARLVEAEADMLGAANHLMAAARAGG